MKYCVKKGELTQDLHQVISLSTRMVVGLSCSDVSGEAGVGGGGGGGVHLRANRETGNSSHFTCSNTYCLWFSYVPIFSDIN